jgi:rubrerythrin
MSVRLFDSPGYPLERQRMSWKDLVKKPISKLDDDAFSRVRVIFMNGMETEAIRFEHMCARFNGEARIPLAQVRRVEQQQATAINWLIGADHSPLETTIAYEQVAIEVTAAVAQQEPDPYLAQAYRFGLLEDFDHLYRYSALLDRLEGKDANNILQGYTDILPGRPTSEHHRAPEHDVRRPYDRRTADALSKLHTVLITGAEYQTHDYYMHVGPLFADPVARQIYAEIASVEEQHVTHYESLMDPAESMLEQWVLHEANEVYTYYSCMEAETNARLKAMWEQFLDYELGHLAVARRCLEDIERRDVSELLPSAIPAALPFTSQRDYVRGVLAHEVDLRTNLTEFVPLEQEGASSLEYRQIVNAGGSPAMAVSIGYHWTPGTELARKAVNF